MWELNSLFGLYLYTGGYKNDFYVSLRQSSVYLMRRGLTQIKTLWNSVLFCGEIHSKPFIFNKNFIF